MTAGRRRGQLRAIIWDFDGTLVDTRDKNLQVTRKIVQAVTGRPASVFPSLRSVDAYEDATRRATNWRDLYQSAFKFTEQQTDDAGALWTEYQLRDDTLAPFFPGIVEVIAELDHLTHGIVSQNSHRNITELLSGVGLLECFQCIVGYEEVDLARQKPEPDGLLMCIERLTGFAPGVVLYVGDHEADVQCAARADSVLMDTASQIRVMAVGAFFAVGSDDGHWPVKPEFRAYHPRDVLQVVGSLLP
jgi:HAD superfamily hydrolase (TIGR01549 family)